MKQETNKTIFELFGYKNPESKGILKWTNRLPDAEVRSEITHSETGVSVMVSQQPLTLQPKLVLLHATWLYDEAGDLSRTKAEFAGEDVQSTMTDRELSSYFQRHALNAPGQPRFEDFGPLAQKTSSATSAIKR
jgi:hypothetical protein